MQQENQSSSFWIVLISMLLGVLIGLLVSPGTAGVRSGSSKSLLSQKVCEVAELVESEYVEDLESDTISDAILNAMLLSLDPHSHYLSAQELTKESEAIQGSFDGIGVVLHYLGDTVYVGEVMSDGPSSGSGLRPGDMIVSVNGDTVSGVKMDKEEVLSRIRGPHGSKVSLLLNRYGSEKLLRYNITRGVVNTPSISYSGMLNASTGYVALSRFAETTGDEFHEALQKLLSKGMTKLVLDLRGNGGGLLAAAVMVADELLPRKELIVYTQGAHQSRRDIKATRGGLFEEGDLVVLIDEYSASASEIVAGAVQDNDRGLVAGRRSFGKGLVQNQFDLIDGSAVWLTVARYYSPSGRCIQRPYSAGSDEYYYDFIERLANAPRSDDSASMVMDVSDSTRFFTKKGRVVYGGGGITPDMLIPYVADSATLSFNALVNSGYPSRQAFMYVRTNYADIKLKYPTSSSFIKSFVLPDELLKSAMKGKSFPAHLQSRLVTLMKSYIAQSLYGSDAFYSIYLSVDNDLIRVKNKLK